MFDHDAKNGPIVLAVTADSNIWISAFKFRGKPRRLIDMADAGEIGPHISELIVQEVLRVLREKFGVGV